MTRIYIDMDHTFCNFNDARLEWAKRAVSETEQKWPWSMVGFFESLLPNEGAIDFWLKWESSCDLWFLTRPSFYNRHCYTEKANGVFRYLGERGLKKLILSPNKSLLIGDILIDDHDQDGQKEFNGLWWRYGSLEFPDWKTVDKQLTKYLYDKGSL